MYVRRVSCLWVSCFAFIKFHQALMFFFSDTLSKRWCAHHTSADQSNVLHSFERSRTFCDLFLHALWLVNIAGTWWWWWWCMWVSEGVSEWSEVKWSEVSEWASEWGREGGREWGSEWVIECVCGWVGEWVSGWVGEWVSGWVSEWEWVSEGCMLCIVCCVLWVVCCCVLLCVVCYVLWERRGGSLGRKVVVDVHGLPLTSPPPANVVSARPKPNRLVRTKASTSVKKQDWRWTCSFPSIGNARNWTYRNQKASSIVI